MTPITPVVNLVQRVESMFITIVKRRLAILKSIDNDTAEFSAIREWITDCNMDYVIPLLMNVDALEEAWEIITEKQRTFSDSEPITEFIISTLTELRFKAFDSEDEYHDYVKQLATATTLCVDSLSIVPKEIIQSLSTTETVNETILSNPWVLLIVLFEQIDISVVLREELFIDEYNEPEHKETLSRH